MQRIIVIQRGNAAQSKIDWIQKRGRDLSITQVITIEACLPEVIDHPKDFLPAHIEADLVLDYTRHPDLTSELARMCHQQGSVVVASGAKVRGQSLFTPVTCCSLTAHASLGTYAEQFGAPSLNVTIQDKRIASVSVLRGSPCGSTWQAADEIVGLSPGQAPEKFGLCVQTLCGAKPSGWDPIHADSPVHAAGRIHAQALTKALRAAGAEW